MYLFEDVSCRKVKKKVVTEAARNNIYQSTLCRSSERAISWGKIESGERERGIDTSGRRQSETSVRAVGHSTGLGRGGTADEEAGERLSVWDARVGKEKVGNRGAGEGIAEKIELC